MFGQFLDVPPSVATFQTVETFGLMLILNVLMMLIFGRTNKAAKLALELNVMLSLQMLPVEVERLTDELAANLLTFDRGRFLSWSFIHGLRAWGFLCQVV